MHSQATHPACAQRVVKGSHKQEPCCLLPPQEPATLRHHGRLLAALKGLSMVGRLLPAVFEPRADEVLDFVVGGVLEADLSRCDVWGGGGRALEPGRVAVMQNHTVPIVLPSAGCE